MALFAMLSILGLVGANLLYVWGAEGWLRSADLTHRLNRRPDRFRISWRAAESPFPGWLIVRDLKLAGRTQRTQWSVQADEVHGALHLSALVRRHLVLSDLAATGVVVRVARTPLLGAPPVGGQPEFDPELPAFSERAGRPRSRWTVVLTDVALDRVREIWLERWRLRGLMNAQGGLRLRLGRDAEVFASRLDLLDAGLSVFGRPAGAHLRGSVAALTTPYSPRRERGWAAVRHVTGELRLAGELPSLEFLLGLMPNVPWLTIEGGDGSFRARLRLAQGKLGQGSSAQIQAKTATVGFFENRAQGQGVLSWRVDNERAIGQADLARCEIRRRGAALPYARAETLHFAVASRDLQLDGRLTDVSGKAELPRVEVPDLRSYNSYLPAGSGLQFTGGRGVSSALLTIDPSGRAEGEMELTATDLAATARGISLKGGCTVALALASRDVTSRRFDLSGSHFRCDGVELRGGEEPTDRGPINGAKGKDALATGWWARGTIRDGLVAPGASDYLSLSGEITARDALPIFALFGDRPSAKIAAFFFRGKGVAATGRIDLQAAAWRASGRGQAGPRLTADARLAGRKGQIDGALLAGIGRRRIGIEILGQERKIHWRSAAAWFAAGKSTEISDRPPS